MSWTAWFTWPRQAITDIQADVGTLVLAGLEIRDRLTRMEIIMADMSVLLTEVANGLRGPLSTSITALIAERDALAASNAALTGEDVAESAAAGDVKAAFDGVAALFAPVVEVPDVEPLPAPPVEDPAPVEPDPAA